MSQKATEPIILPLQTQVGFEVNNRSNRNSMKHHSTITTEGKKSYENVHTSGRLKENSIRMVDPDNRSVVDKTASAV